MNESFKKLTDWISDRTTSIFATISITLIIVIVFLSNKYSLAQQQIHDTTDQYNSLYASYTDATNQLNLATTTNAEMTAINEDLSSQLDALTKTNTTLTSKNKSLTAENKELTDENASIVESYTEAMQTRYKYTDLDYEYLLRMAETETYGADMMSKTHVISVALNRAKAYGISPYAVITSPNQFAYGRTAISQSSIDALEYVLYNGDTAQGALFFHSGGYSSTFCGRPCIFGDDVGHYFY